MNQDTALVRGIRTFVQVAIATILAVWAVPGVPEAVGNQILPVVVGIGVPTAIVSFIWNVLRSDVKNF